MSRRLGEPLGFIRIEVFRFSRRNIAKGTGAGANIAHDHKSRMFSLPALANVGATCLLAYRVELQPFHKVKSLCIIKAAWRSHADPVRLRRPKTVRILLLFGMAKAAIGHRWLHMHDAAIGIKNRFVHAF